MEKTEGGGMRGSARVMPGGDNMEGTDEMKKMVVADGKDGNGMAGIN